MSAFFVRIVLRIHYECGCVTPQPLRELGCSAVPIAISFSDCVVSRLRNHCLVCRSCESCLVQGEFLILPSSYTAHLMRRLLIRCSLVWSWKKLGYRYSYFIWSCKVLLGASWASGKTWCHHDNDAGKWLPWENNRSAGQGSEWGGNPSRPFEESMPIII